MNVPYPRDKLNVIDPSPDLDEEDTGCFDEYGSSDYSDDFECESDQTTPTCSPQKGGGQQFSKPCRKKCSTLKIRRKDMNKETLVRNSLVAKMMLVKEEKVRKIQNEFFDISKKFEQLSKENRMLKSLQQKQEKEIRKFENTENDLPRLLSQQAEEEKALRFRLRKAQTAERELGIQLRDNNKSMLRMECNLEKLRNLVRQKELGERSRLTKALADKERTLETAEEKIEKLHKHLELTSGCFLRQIDIERRRHKQTMKKLDGAIKECDVTKQKLREKERALSNANVYALRKKQSSQKQRNLASHKQPVDKTIKQISKSKLALTSTSVQTLSDSIPSTSPSMNSENGGDTLELEFSESCESLGEPLVLGEDSKSDYNTVQHETNEEATRPEKQEKESTKSNKDSHLVLAERDFQSTSPIRTKLNDGSETRDYSSNVETLNDETPSIFLTKKFENRSTQFLMKSKNIAQNFDQGETLFDFLNPTNSFVRNDKELEMKSQNQRFSMEATSSPTSETSKNTVNCKNPVTDSNDITQRRGTSARVDWVEPEKYTVEKSQKKGYQFSKEIENLHLGIPSSIEGCKKKLEKIEKEVLYFGSYSPTVGDPPTRRTLPVRNYTPVSPRKSTKQNNTDAKVTKESDLLMRLFGKIEADKNKLLCEVKDIPNLDLHAREGCDQPWQKNLKISPNSTGNGDSLKSSLKTTLQNDDDFSFLNQHIDKEPT